MSGTRCSVEHHVVCVYFSPFDSFFALQTIDVGFVTLFTRFGVSVTVCLMLHRDDVHDDPLVRVLFIRRLSLPLFFFSGLFSLTNGRVKAFFFFHDGHVTQSIHCVVYRSRLKLFN